MHWRANKKAWMNSSLFTDWFSKCFCPEVELYCKTQNLDFKVLLILDNAPSHPQALCNSNPNVKVVFMPPNTTSIIQPMDQGIIATFKKMYLRQTFRKMLEAIDGPHKPTLREFWRKYNIADAIANIKPSWCDIKNTTMNAVWRPLWPECVEDDVGDASDCNVENLLCLGRQIGGEGFQDLELSDINELLEAHDAELSVHELIELEETDELTTKNLEKLITKINEAVVIIESTDSNLERSSTCTAGLLSSSAPYRASLSFLNLSMSTKLGREIQCLIFYFFVMNCFCS